MDLVNRYKKDVNNEVDMYNIWQEMLQFFDDYYVIYRGSSNLLQKGSLNGSQEVMQRIDDLIDKSSSLNLDEIDNCNKIFKLLSQLRLSKDYYEKVRNAWSVESNRIVSQPYDVVIKDFERIYSKKEKDLSFASSLVFRGCREEGKVGSCAYSCTYPKSNQSVFDFVSDYIKILYSKKHTIMSKLVGGPQLEEKISSSEMLRNVNLIDEMLDNIADYIRDNPNSKSFYKLRDELVQVRESMERDLSILHDLEESKKEEESRARISAKKVHTKEEDREAIRVLLSKIDSIEKKQQDLSRHGRSETEKWNRDGEYIGSEFHGVTHIENRNTYDELEKEKLALQYQIRHLEGRAEYEQKEKVQNRNEILQAAAERYKKLSIFQKAIYRLNGKHPDAALVFSDSLSDSEIEGMYRKHG